eukprot:1157180-Pelagomonas_calceolata.AAC.2
MGVWRVTGSTWLQNLAVRSAFVLESTPSGNKFMSILNRMGRDLQPGLSQATGNSAPSNIKRQGLKS